MNLINSFRALESFKNEDKHSLSIVEKNIADLPPGELLIKVEYSSLNYKDAMSAKGIPGVTREYPHTPGIDASGYIVQSASSKFKEGDAVIITGYDLGMNTSGGFAEYIRVPESWAVHLPKDLSLRNAMVLGTAGLTAGLSVLALEKYGDLQNKDSVVSGSTGGVGSVALLLLAKLGSNVTAISGKPEAEKYLKSLGANKIVSREQIYKETRKPLDKPSWDVGIDVAGGEMIPTLLASIKPNGAIACSGLVAGASFEASIFPFILRGVSLIGIDSVEILLERKIEVWNKFASEWSLENLDSITKEVSLDNLSLEIDMILSGSQIGRVLVKI